jgi:hypothetical protein
MEQVLAPSFKFKPKFPDEDEENQVNEDGEEYITINGFKLPSSQRAKAIIESDINDLKAKIMQDDTMLKAMPGNVDPEVINKVLIPKIIKETYPDLSDEEVEAVRQHIVVDSVIKNGTIEEVGDKRFIRMADSFVNIDAINIDLIDTINPFQKAFEILSKSVTASVFKAIQETIDATRITMTDEEAIILWPKIKNWIAKTGEQPNIQSFDPQERRLAEAILFLKEQKRKAQANE